MHIYFSGIGGTAIGPLALIAHQAGYTVSGSDKHGSSYIDYLKSRGIENISLDQNETSISAVHKNHPIDWLVHSSAVSIENPNHPELVFAKKNGIHTSKRDELLNKIITDNNLKLIAIAGTHGKTTTTAMVIWLFLQLKIPVSYSVGAKISFGEMGYFHPASEYFIYECDEYDRNFLAFNPYVSIITGIAYDHHDIFPTEQDYLSAFLDFINQSSSVVLWAEDKEKLQLTDSDFLHQVQGVMPSIKLAGLVNRQNATLAINGVSQIYKRPNNSLVDIINTFPGVSRRFEKLADNIYTDYAHTPEKILGCLEMAHELSKKLVVVYEPLTNKRQYFIKEVYKDLFTGVDKLYWVPSYLTREDPNQHVLTPDELMQYMGNKQIATASELDDQLFGAIKKHQEKGDIVVCISGGGGGSLDEWIRKKLS